MRDRERAMGAVNYRREEHWRRSERHKQHRSSSKFITFFFSNFPGSHGELDILKIFQK